MLVRICYDKNGRYTFMDLLAPYVTGRGYAFVVQDVRGKFRSEGTTMAFVHESHDGYDTLEWISNQPWSDGRVGMFGDSYYGFTQWAAVASGHRALRAIVPRVTSADLGMVNGGRYRSPDGDVEDVDWFVSASYLSHFWLDQLIHDYPIDVERRPLRDVFEPAFEALGRRSNSFDVVVPRKIPLQVYPDGHPFDAKPLPVLHSVGWFDNLQIPHMRDYVELMSRPEWAPLQYLIADSVDHENYHLDLAPIEDHVEHDHIVNDDALQRLMPLYLEPALEFFDVFLKGANPVDSIPRVRWHLGHEGYHESGRPGRPRAPSSDNSSWVTSRRRRPARGRSATHRRRPVRRRVVGPRPDGPRAAVRSRTASASSTGTPTRPPPACATTCWSSRALRSLRRSTSPVQSTSSLGSPPARRRPTSTASSSTSTRRATPT